MKVLKAGRRKFRSRKKLVEDKPPIKESLPPDKKKVSYDSRNCAEDDFCDFFGSEFVSDTPIERKEDAVFSGEDMFGDTLSDTPVVEAIDYPVIIEGPEFEFSVEDEPKVEEKFDYSFTHLNIKTQRAIRRSKDPQKEYTALVVKHKKEGKSYDPRLPASEQKKAKIEKPLFALEPNEAEGVRKARLIAAKAKKKARLRRQDLRKRDLAEARLQPAKEREVSWGVKSTTVRSALSERPHPAKLRKESLKVEKSRLKQDAEQFRLAVAREKKAKNKRAKAARKVVRDAGKTKSAKTEAGVQKEYERGDGRTPARDAEKFHEFTSKDVWETNPAMWLDLMLAQDDVLTPEISAALVEGRNFIFYTATFGYQLYRARNKKDVMAAVSQYAGTFGVCALSVPSLVINSILDATTNRTRTESLAEVVDTMNDFLNKILGSSFLKSIRDAVLSLVSLHVFEKDFAMSIRKFFGDGGKETFLGFLSKLMSCIKHMIRAGQLLLQGYPLSEVLFADDPISKSVALSRELLKKKDNIYYGLPVEHFFDARAIYKDMKTQLLFIEKALSDMRRTDPQYSSLSAIQVDLAAAQKSIYSRLCTEKRATPVAICVCGTPGIGKSELIADICEIWSRVKGRVYDSSQVYVKTMGSEYWEQFDPISHSIIRMSEQGNLADEVMKTSGATELGEINRLVDDLPFPVNMAFGDKGGIFAAPEVVMADTNNDKMGADVVMKCPEAIYRRFLYIRVTVRPEFKKEGCDMLDSSKSIEAGGDLRDRYYFKIFVREPKGSSFVERVLLETESHATYVEFLQKRFEQHIELNDRKLKAFRKAAGLDKDDPEPVIPDAPKEEMTPEFEFAIHLTADQAMIDRCVRFCEKEVLADEKAPGDLDRNGYVEALATAVLPKMIALPLKNDRSSTEIKEYLREKLDASLNRWEVMRQGPVPTESGIEDIRDMIHIVSKSERVASLKKRMANFGKDSWEFTRFITADATRSQALGNLLGCEAYRYCEARELLVIHTLMFTLMLSAFLPFIWFFAKLVLYLFFSLKLTMTVLRTYVLNFPNARLKKSQLIWRECMYRSGMSNEYVLRKSIQGATFLAITAAVTVVLKKWKKVTTAVTEYSADHIATRIEESVDATPGRIRIPNKVNATWNDMVTFEQLTPYTGSIDEFKTLIYPNIRRSKVFESPDLSRSGHVFGVKNSYFLINAHSVVDPGLGFTIGIESSMHSNVWKSYTVYPKNLTVVPGRDLIVFYLPGVSTCRNVLSHISPDYQHTAKSVSAIGDIMTNATYFPGKLILDDARNGTSEITKYFEYDDPSHGDGRCGLPLLVERGSRICVGGIHCAGKDAKGLSTALTVDVIIQAIAVIDGQMPYMQLHTVQGTTESCVEPISKSATRYVHMPAVTLFGKIADKPVLVKSKSKLIKSDVALDLPVLFTTYFGGVPKNLFVKPMMKPGWRNEVYISPWNIGLAKIGMATPTLDPSVMSVVIDRYVEFILSKIEDIPTLTPLTFDVAINGYEKDCYMRRMNVATAAGYPYGGQKKEFLPQVSEDFREMDEKMSIDLESMIDAYLEDDTYGHIFTANLKDEPRLIEKVVEGKTRIFFGGSVLLQVASRAFLAPFYTLMCERGDAFGSCVGINMHSGADKFVRELLEMSELLMEGDYTNYDQGMPFEIGLAASTVIIRVLRAKGYNERAIKITIGLLSDGMYPIVEVLSDLIMKPGLQASGKYGTAEENSLRGVIMLMYAWYANPELKDSDFFEFVLPRTYGDDLLTAVSTRFSEKYNNVYYSRFCDDVYGLKYTSASKGDVSDKFLDIHTASFLKRKFVFDERLGKWCAPLAKSTLYKMLEWTMPSAHVSKHDQLIATFQSFLWESYISLRVEKEYFDLRNDCIALLDKALPTENEGTLALMMPTFTDVETRIFGVPTESGESFEDPAEWSFPFLEPENRLMICVICGEINCSNEASQGYPACFGTFWRDRKSASPESSDDYLPSSTPILYRQAAFENKEGARERAHEALTFHREQIAKATDRTSLHMAYKRAREDIDEKYMLLIREFPPIGVVADVGWEDSSDDPTAVLVSRLQVFLYEASATLEKLRRKDTGKRVRTESGVDGVMQHGLVDSSTVDVKENLEDIGGAARTLESAGYSAYPDVGQRHFLTKDDFFQRPIEIYAATVPMSSQFDVVLNLWDLWSKDEAVRTQLKYSAYLSCDLSATVVITGTNFHYGKVMVSYQPYPVNNTCLQYHVSSYAAQPTWRPLFLNYLSQAQGLVIMDVAENKPLDIEIPFLSSKAMHRLWNASPGVITSVDSYDDLLNAGKLYIYSVNPPESVSPTPTDIYIQVYVSATNVELGCPTATVVQAESGVTVESDEKSTITMTSTGRDERKVGPVERVSSQMASMFKQLVRIPVIGPYALASHITASAVADVSSMFGWSKPVKDPDPTYVHLDPMTNSAVLSGFSTAKRMVMDPHQELTVDPRCMGVEADEMSFAHLSQIRTYLTTFQWKATDPKDVTLWSCVVSPELRTHVDIVAKRYVQPTAMDYVVAPFAFWRADIVYRFEFVCSSFHRGKIKIAFEPNRNQALLLDGDSLLNKQYAVFVDIQQTQTIDVCVNWAAQRAWCNTTGADADANYQPAGWVPPGVGSSIGESNGLIYLTPFTELTSPDDSTIEVNVYVHARDLQVNYLDETNMPTERLSVAAPGRAFTESGVDATQDVSCVELNKSSADGSSATLYHFGERVASFRSAISRYTTTQYLANPVAGSAVGTIRFFSRIIPDPNPAFGGTLTGVQGLIQYLRYAYLGTRGGVRKRWHNSGDLGLAIGSRVSVFLERSETPLDPPSNATNALPTRLFLRSSIDFRPALNDGIEVEIPMLTSNMFLFSCADDLVGTAAGNEFATSWPKSYAVDCSHTADPNGDGFAVEDTAAAEDFTMFRFLGAPFYSR